MNGCRLLSEVRQEEVLVVRLDQVLEHMASLPATGRVRRGDACGAQQAICLLSERVRDRRLRFGLRPWRPWRAIEAATDFFDTRQPSATRSSHTRGVPRRTRRAAPLGASGPVPPFVERGLGHIERPAGDRVGNTVLGPLGRR